MERNQLNKIFDKIYFINLKRRADRFVNIKRRLKEKGIVAERFAAIEGGHVDKSKLRFENPLKRLDNGEIGCHLSHQAIWNLQKKNGYKRVLILEDDAIFTSHFDTFDFDKVPDYDLFYLGQWNYDNDINGGNDKNGDKFALKKEVAPGIWKADRCWLTHAYAVDLKCVDYLIENTQNMYSSIDNIMADIQCNLNVYAAHPNLINQDGSRGDLRLNIY